MNITQLHSIIDTALGRRQTELSGAACDELLKGEDDSGAIATELAVRAKEVLESREIVRSVFEAIVEKLTPAEDAPDEDAPAEEVSAEPPCTTDEATAES